MDQKRVKYPIGEQDFKSLIQGGFLYVDKTRYVYELSHSNKYYFLSRPRRFGKSLLLSTLRYYFEGRRELFSGLDIDRLETEWRNHPVLMLELSRVNSYDPDSLYAHLNHQISEWEEQLQITNIEKDLSARFSKVIKETAKQTGEGVVILVDEYDNPLINTLHSKELHERNKELLKSVYSNLKALGEYIRFAMLTGVSRFSHMSIFSGLNNLDDISLSDKYGAICGITRSELLEYFETGISTMAEKESKGKEEILEELKNFYDGYHFSAESPDIYNPFSLLSAFNTGRLGSYWMRTGTPTFLIKRLIDERVDLNELFNSEAEEQSLAESDLSYSSIVALLFQTGYLTIKDYDREWNLYKLGIPNREVSKGLFEGLMNIVRERGSQP